MTAANGDDGAFSEGGHGFAVVLRELRLASGLTQAELARLAAVSLGTVRDLEQGRRGRPRAVSVARLARALDLTAAQSERLAAAGAERHRGPAADQGPVPGTGLWVQVLGPVAAWRDGLPVEMGSSRQRAVLAVLALGQGQPVRREALVDALWPDGPPASAVNLVQGYVSELRQALGAHRRDGVLTWSGESYQLRLGPAELDLLAFEELAGQAAAAVDAVRACELYERALGLWRGDVAQHVAATAGHPAATALAARRGEVVVEWARLACELGEPERVLRELRALAVREPLDERAHAWLMAVLAGSGQQAAALEVFAACRDRLDEELGVRPGPELARAHERVLRQVPRQLPAAVGGFVGREEELAALTSLIGQPGQPGAAGQPGAVVISAIGGTAGVGKTALAVHWAHQVAARFRDGQLYVNLRGYDPDQPMPPADALAAFLRALGVTEGRIAADTGERAAQYRSLLAGRRMLIVLDNAGSVEQVRPLLPATPECMVIVTSRDALAGLVARDGARRLELDLLPPAEAQALLRELIGERAATDPGATAALAALCARLPLALRVAAEHAVSRPAAALSDLVDELAGQDSRLDLLSAGGDSRTAVRAVFSWSCHGLAAETVRAFRLLGLHPGPDLDSYAVAALAATTPVNAQRLLEVLAAAYLVQPAQPGRYVLHDLLRAYARELAAAADGGEGERAALTRLFDHYLGASAAAMDTLFPGERHARPAAVPASRVLSLTRPAAARAWLEAQRLCLVAASAHMAAHGWPGHATRLARILFSYLDGGHTLDAITMHTHAVQAARQAGDRVAETTALLDLMLVDVNRGRFRQAVTNLQQALDLYQLAGDQAGVARVLGNLGQANMYLGHYPLAIAQCRQALGMYRQAGDRPRQTHALETLARIYVRQGCYPRADACLREALELGRGQDNQAGRAYVLIHLSQLRLRQGDRQQAADHAHQALEWFRELGNTSGVAHARLALSRVDLSRGHYQQAVSEIRAVLSVYEAIGERNDEGRALVSLAEAEFGRGDSEQAGRLLDQVLALFRETGDRTGEAGVLNLLGTVALAAGQPADASAWHAAALALAAEIGDRAEQARAHRGLSRACAALGETDQGRRHGVQALELFTQLGVPEADEVRREVAAVARHRPSRAGPGQLAGRGISAG